MLLCLLTGRLSLSPPALPDAVFTLRRLFCFPQPNALTYTLLCFFDCLYHGILSLFVFFLFDFFCFFVFLLIYMIFPLHFLSFISLTFLLF